MSRIGNRMNEIMASLESEEAMEAVKTSITMRVDDFTLYCLDRLRDEVGGKKVTRTGMVNELVSEGVIDGLEALGHTMDTLQVDYLEDMKKRREAQKEGK